MRKEGGGGEKGNREKKRRSGKREWKRKVREEKES